MEKWGVDCYKLCAVYATTAAAVTLDYPEESPLPDFASLFLSPDLVLVCHNVHVYWCEWGKECPLTRPFLSAKRAG